MTSDSADGSVNEIDDARARFIARPLPAALEAGLAHLDEREALVVVDGDGAKAFGRAALRAAAERARTDMLADAGPRADRVEIGSPVGLDAFAAWIGAVLAGLVPVMTAGGATPWRRVRGGAAASSGAQAPAGEAPQVALVQRTSGSTGAPKTIEVTARRVLAQVWGLGRALGLSDDDRIVSCLPLHHDMGLVSTVLVPLLCGVRVVHVDPALWRSDPTALLGAIDRHQATLTWLPPAALGRLMRSATTWRGDLGSLRELVCGGDVLDARTRDAFEAAFADHGAAPGVVRTGWGMAENVAAVTHAARGAAVRNVDVAWTRFASGRVATSAPGEPAFALLSVGAPIVGTEVRVVGEPGEGVLGELEIRGDCQRDPTKWHATGDVGLVLGGEVHHCGRLADLVAEGGRWIPPHLAELAAARVPGVRAGRVAAVQARDGGFDLLVEHDTPVDREAVARAVADEVGCRPRVRLVAPDALIRTTSGKLARQPIAAALAAGALDAS